MDRGLLQFRSAAPHVAAALHRFTSQLPHWAGPPQRRNLRYAAIGLAVIVLLVLADVVIGSPGASEIRTLSHMPVATAVLDRNDQPAFTIFEERRYDVPLDRISKNLRQAVIAIEDQRFYQHGGLDLWRIAGSAWANLRNTSLDQGGSTITQQLAKLSFLTPAKSFRRKLKEAYLAIRIESHYTKDEILETYLNKVYFGNGLYGAEAAARGYFNKQAADLTVAEGALLAGLIQRPSAYAPDQHLDRAMARRTVVLQQMVDARMIDRNSAQALAKTPVVLVNGFAHEELGAYFNQMVTRELVNRFGWDRVSRGGLRVYTTYDQAAQRAAEKSLADGLAAIERRKQFKYPARAKVVASAPGQTPGAKNDAQSPDYLQGALVALDPSTGEVRALVGGRDYSESSFDRVTQAHRQAGSAFKPFVYAAALEQGYTPATLITDLDRPIWTPEGLWLPDDGHAAEPEMMTMRTALRTSSNRAAAQVLQRVGVHEAVTYAKQVGLDAPEVPSLVLGTGDVTLMSLTMAYGVFASGGMLSRPLMIRRVEDANGEVLFRDEPDSKRVVNSTTAFQITSMLADVVDRGTAWQARQGGFRMPAAGKTGTTNDYRDAWFVGYTADLVAGVWVGFDRPKTIVPGGYASDLAVPIWGAFMRDATAGMKARNFTRPAGLVAVEICRDSGLLPTAACTRVRRELPNGESREVSTVGIEYFRPGTEPTEECPIHQTTWFGGVKTASFDIGNLPARSVLRAPPKASVDRDESSALASTVATRDRAKAPAEKKKGFWGRLFGR